jgi:hypothetical protein
MAQIHSPSTAELVDVVEMDTVQQEIVALAEAARAMRPNRPGLLEAGRIDGLAATLFDTHDKLTAVSEGIGQAQGVETSGIRQRFEQEVAAVAQERLDYEATIVAARDVSLDITREGFGRLEDFFADSVVKADMGIVDVFWAEKLEIDDELERVRTERELQLADLEKRFQLIREKMGEPK